MSLISTGPRPRVSTWFASALVLLFAFWLRMVNLYALPAFIDEGVHVLWAQRWAVGNVEYPWLMDGRIATVILLSWVRMDGADPLWVARAFVAIISTLACGACISIGAQLNSRKAGLLAGLLYALLPLAVFHERQVLADPVAGAFGAFAMALSLRMTRDKQRWLFLGLGLLLALTFLTKVQGIVVVVYILFNAFAAISRPSRECLNNWVRYGGAILVASLLIATFFTVFKARLGRTDVTSIQTTTISANLTDSLSGALGQANPFLISAAQVAAIIGSEAGWVVAGLAVLSLFIARPRQQFHVAGLFLFGLVIAGTTVVAELIGLVPCCGNLTPARYIMLIGVPIAVLAALTLINLARLLPGGSIGWLAGQWRLAVLAILLAVALPAMLRDDAAILTIPEKAHYSDLDFWGYFSGYYPSRQLVQAVERIKTLEADAPVLPVIIVEGGPVYIVGAYFDRQKVDVRASGELFPVEFGEWFARGQHVYLIDEVTPDTTVEPCHTDYGTECTEIDRYLVPYSDDGRAIRLRLATSADENLRALIYPEFFPRPEKLTAEYEALVAGLPADAPINLLVYPPNQSIALEPLTVGKPNITVIPIGDSWPLDIPAAEDQLQTITASQSRIQAVLVEETKGDPERRLETWLKTHLFILGEQWFGPVRLLNFAGDGLVDQAIPVTGHFGESITLESVELLDSSVQPGGVVRLRLNWSASSAISSQYKVFTHIFAGDTIIAQHDGQPVAELRPTNTWQIGEKIRDQFAIQLPADAPPGTYQLRIGLYEIETQARLPALFPDGASAEFFTGGTINIQ